MKSAARPLVALLLLAGTACAPRPVVPAPSFDVVDPAPVRSVGAVAVATRLWEQTLIAWMQQPPLESEPEFALV